MLKRCSGNAMPSQDGAISRQRRANIVVPKQRCTKKWCRANMTPCQHVVVSKRRRVKRIRVDTMSYQGDDAPRQRLVNTMPYQKNDEVSTRCRAKMVLCQKCKNGVVDYHDGVALTRHRLDTALCWHGIVLTRHRFDKTSC